MLVRYWLAVALAAALALAACSSDPTPLPSASPQATPSATPSPPEATPTAGAVTPTSSASPASPSQPPTPSPGLDWSAVELPIDPAFATLGVIDIAVLEGVFLAVGAGWQEGERGVLVNVPQFWRSADGRDWELLGDAGWSEGYIDALTTWQGQFVAAGYVGEERASAAFWTSADGAAWQRLPDRPVLQFFRGATEGRDIVSGGITHLHGDADELVARGWLYCACASEIRHAAVEWRTSDGREWRRTELPLGGDAPPPVSTANGLARISSDGGAVEASADGGASWQVVWAPSDAAEGEGALAQLFSIGAWSGGLLAVGSWFDAGVGRPLALASQDGLAWSRSTDATMESTRGALLRFAATPDRLVAVGRLSDPPQPFIWLHER